MRQWGFLLVVACLGLPLRAAGQEARAPSVPIPEPPPAELLAIEECGAEPAAEPPGPAQQPVVLDPTAPAKTEVTLDRATRVGVGIGISGPIGAAGSLRVLHGLGADVRDDSTKVKAVCAVPIPHCAQGFLLQADAGSGGGKLSLGLGAWANVDEEDFRGTAGVALRLALARTWGDPIGTEPDLTYLGPELDLSVIRINLTIGVLFRISGDGGSGTLFSWGLGFGL
jgi:hypothetical protein